MNHAASPGRARGWPQSFAGCRTGSLDSIPELLGWITSTLSVCGFKCTNQHFEKEEGKTHSSHRAGDTPAFPSGACVCGMLGVQEGAFAPPHPRPPQTCRENGRMLVQGFLSTKTSWNLRSGGQVSVWASFLTEEIEAVVENLGKPIGFS